MKHVQYVLRPEDVPSYSPANHSGTKNHRLVAPGINGARYMEIIYGDIERHEGAVAHAHPDLERLGDAFSHLRDWHPQAGRRARELKSELATLASSRDDVREAIARSARRTALRRTEKSPLPPRSWVLAPETTRSDLERALLRIDVFPRAAVLLLIFEQVPLKDAAIDWLAA